MSLTWLSTNSTCAPPGWLRKTNVDILQRGSFDTTLRAAFKGIRWHFVDRTDAHVFIMNALVGESMACPCIFVRAIVLRQRYVTPVMEKDLPVVVSGTGPNVDGDLRWTLIDSCSSLGSRSSGSTLSLLSLLSRSGCGEFLHSLVAHCRLTLVSRHGV